MKRIYDENKIDVSLAPQSIASTSATGEFFPLKDTRIIGFPVGIAAMATGETVVCQLVQATDASGSGVKNITGATCTVTAETNVQRATVTLATFTAGSVIVINGLTYTAHATTTTVANREFSIAGTDTQDAAELVTCINDATYGVPGVTASSALGVVTLVCTVTGVNDITVVGVATIGVAATLQAQAYLEIPTDILDTNNGFTHIALKVTTTGTIICSGGMIRESERYTPTQYLGGEYLG